MFLDEDNNVKLGDFGLARVVGIDQMIENKKPGKNKIVDEGSLTTGLGTMRFSAPEQMEGRGRYGFKVDNYSCGIVLMEMFRNQDVPGSLVQSIINYVKEGLVEPSIREKMPEEAVTLIVSMI